MKPICAKIPPFSTRVAELDKKAIALEEQRKENEKLLDVNHYFKDDDDELSKKQKLVQNQIKLGLAGRLRTSIVLS